MLALRVVLLLAGDVTTESLGLEPIEDNEDTVSGCNVHMLVLVLQ